MVLRPTFELALPDIEAVSPPRLEGQKIVVTRAVPQAASLLGALNDRGAMAIALPLLQIVDAADGGAALERAVARLQVIDWLVVLSPNGARRIVSRLMPGPRPQLAVIASGTGRVMEEAGWPADLVPAAASSVGLLEAFADVELVGRVLIAQAENGRTELADGLLARGVEVEVVAAYRNEMPELDEVALAAARYADVVVFASPSAVERYITHVGGTPTRAVCIGAVTAETAAAAGFDVAISTAPTVDAIVAAIESCSA